MEGYAALGGLEGVRLEMGFVTVVIGDVGCFSLVEETLGFLFWEELLSWCGIHVFKVFYGGVAEGFGLVVGEDLLLYFGIALTLVHGHWMGGEGLLHFVKVVVLTFGLIKLT